MRQRWRALRSERDTQPLSLSRLDHGVRRLDAKLGGFGANNGCRSKGEGKCSERERGPAPLTRYGAISCASSRALSSCALA